MNIGIRFYFATPGVQESWWAFAWCGFPEDYEYDGRLPKYEVGVRLLGFCILIDLDY